MSCLRDVNKRVFSSLQPCDLSCTSVQFTLYTVESLRVCFVTNQITFPFDLLHIFDRLETLQLCRPVQKKAIKFHCSLHFCFTSTALFFLLRHAVYLPCWLLLFYWILGRFLLIHFTPRDCCDSKPTDNNHLWAKTDTKTFWMLFER